MIKQQFKYSIIFKHLENDELSDEAREIKKESEHNNEYDEIAELRKISQEIKTNEFNFLTTT